MEYIWLNDMSQQFLERDYLLKGQTVDERVDIICNNAERILNKPGFAKAFKENFAKGWYSLSTPIWSNFGHKRGLPISCVVGSTLIKTNLGDKQAKDVEIGDSVLTHKGRYQKVTNVIVTNNKSNIYRLKTFSMTDDLYLTGDHLVLTNFGWIAVEDIDLHLHLATISQEETVYKVYTPICSLEKTDRKEDVYDFTVEEDHSFSAAGIILHNCFGSHISDSMESIAYTWSEVCMMTKYGGGTSAYFGDIRHRGAEIQDNGESSGSVHFMQVFDNLINVVSQGRCRRGNFAAYLPIDHKDILEFLTLRSEGAPIQDLSFGVCVSDYWLQEMISGDKDKRKVWAKVLECRANIGFPYIMFTDTVNKNTVDCYKNRYRINHSNLCSEIMLPDGPDESFVCDLSSMNILYYEDWKNTNAVELLTYFLDAVMTEFIEKAKKVTFMDRAAKFAENHRAIGIGWLGWHSYLQSKMIPWESMTAKYKNVEIAKNIKNAAYAASAKLATEYGEPPVLKGFGRRNSTLCAIAPTKSSAFIIGQVSECIEPHRTNYYIKDLQKGKFTIKNNHLVQLLQEKCLDTKEIWDSILKQGGSVQHLDCLSKLEKDVFKTFCEISPKEIIIQAAQRQKYIDQSQSLNLMIHPSIPIKEVNELILEAWRLGVKSLYYQISVNAAQAFSREILSCTNCES